MESLAALTIYHKENGNFDVAKEDDKKLATFVSRNRKDYKEYAKWDDKQHDDGGDHGMPAQPWASPLACTGSTPAHTLSCSPAPHVCPCSCVCSRGRGVSS